MSKRIVATIILSLSLLPTTPALGSVSPSEGFKCPTAMKIARTAGWKTHHLPKLDLIIHRETGGTCKSGVIGWNYHTGKSHLDCPPKKTWQKYRQCRHIKSADFGYTQINDKTWVEYLKQNKIIKHPRELFNRRTNLKAAKALYDYAADRGEHGWKAWDTKKPNGSGNVSK
jgi:hypothetical protein